MPIPIGAGAKFSVNGKTTGKKDLGMQAIAHGTAYVATIVMGVNDAHTIRTKLEAEDSLERLSLLRMQLYSTWN